MFVIALFSIARFGPMPMLVTSLIYRLLLGLCGLSVLILSACSGTQGGLYDTLAVAISDPSKTIESQALKPELSYLRVSVNGQPALMVLGYLDPHPNGPIEVWYSADKEVIRIQNQRLLGTQGLRINWINTELVNAPVFSEVLERLSTSTRNRPRSLRFTRIRTSMPDYAVNVRDSVLIQVSDPPSQLPRSIKTIRASRPNSLIWVSETTQITIEGPQSRITPLEAIYAVDRAQPARVLYAKQCLAPNYCVEWQPWPPPAPAGQIPSNPTPIDTLDKVARP